MTNLIFHNPELSEEMYRKFADFIYRQSGINLGDNKQELVKTRFSKRIRLLGLKSFEEYYDYVIRQRHPEELTNMIDAISTNYTFFFREKDHFDFLSSEAIPEILQTKKRQGLRKVRAWCAAASTGEEPYTIMICLREGIDAGWDIRLLATDISTKVLKKAQAGVYEKKQIATVSQDLQQKYFDSFVDETGEVKYKVKPILQQSLYFRYFNLMTPQFPFKGKFDFIFCRNVMIYFDRPTQDALTEKMLNFIEPGGYLFVGHSETLGGRAKERVKMMGPACYKKLR